MGLLSGALATAGMTAVMAAGMASGKAPMPEAIPIAIIKLILKDAPKQALILTGMLSHFLYGAGAGFVFLYFFKNRAFEVKFGMLWGFSFG